MDTRVGKVIAIEAQTVTGKVTNPLHLLHENTCTQLENLFHRTLIPKAMDLFDMGDGFPSVLDGVGRVKCPVLVCV